MVPETQFAQPQVITDQPDTRDCAIPDIKVVPETQFAKPQVITEQPDTRDCAIPNIKVVPETQFSKPQVITEQPDARDCAIPDSEQSNFFIGSIHYPMTTWFTNLDLYFYCSIYVMFTVT